MEERRKHSACNINHQAIQFRTNLAPTLLHSIATPVTDGLTALYYSYCKHAQTIDITWRSVSE